MATFSEVLRGFGKVTIVTGGTSGIGEACARAFARAGAPVVICEPDAARGEARAAQIAREEAGDCRFVPCDIRQPEQVRHLVEETVRLFGRLDCLVNNAGWHPPHYPIDDFSIEDFQSLLQLNLMGCYAGCKYALPYLRQTRGSIINISSLVGAVGQEHAVTYVATKGAITALTKALAVDESRHGVRVNAVSPGIIMTPLLQSFIDANSNPAQLQATLDASQWTGRIGTAAEVAEACLFLASDGASFITGVELPLTGGAELAYGVKLPKDGASHL